MGTDFAPIAKAVASGLCTHAYAAYGRLDQPTPVAEHATLPDGRDVFDLASLTKAVVTTPLVFAALNATPSLSLDSTLGGWLGERAADLDARLRALTLRQLLRHDTGLPAWRNWWVCHLGVAPQPNSADFEGRLVEGLNRAAAELVPGGPTGPVYSDVGFLLLGLALVRASVDKVGTDLAAQLTALNAALGFGKEPLGYPQTLAAQGVDLAARAVPSAYCEVRQRLLVGEVHDENCASLGGVTGHAGVFGTGRALCAYLYRLAASPVGKALLSANAAARVLPPGDPPNESLLGWRQGSTASSLPFGGGKAMGHMGFTGVAFWVCPDERDYVMLLTNRVISGRNRPGIMDVRRETYASLARLREARAL